MSDIWLATAEEERKPALPSSLSDRAAARASRPRPWLQSMSRVKSQTPTTTLTSKPRSTPAASTATPVDRLAAAVKPTAAQSETDLFLEVGLSAEEAQVKPAPLPPAAEAAFASHVRRWQGYHGASRIPAPVGSTLARSRTSSCPCGNKDCDYRKVLERDVAKSAARREQITAARRERIAAIPPPKFSKRLDKLEALAKDLAGQGNCSSAPRTSVGQKAAPVRGSKYLTSRRSKQVVAQPAVLSQPRGILRMPGQKNAAAKKVCFSGVEIREVTRWIGDMDVATGTPVDQVLTDDGEPIVNSMYIHVHVARPCSPRPASQARFGFGAAYPPGMVMRGWVLVDAEEKAYGRFWRG